jgi:signal transduction histidine kinase
MDIKDDGQGFDADGKSNPKQHNRLGLIGMRERVEMVGGTFHVESTPGQSTTIRVEIPADKHRGRKSPHMSTTLDPME